MNNKTSTERKEQVTSQTEIDFEGIERRFLDEIPHVWGEGVETQDFAPLMRNYSEDDPLEKKLRAQMRHNSGHALFFLALIAGGLTCGKSMGVEHFPKVKRIVAHLLFLKQFIQSEQVQLKLTVDHLYQALLTELPETKLEWTHFIYQNWFLIRSLAKQFNCHGQCFRESTYIQLRDLYLGKQLSESGEKTKQEIRVERQACQRSVFDTYPSINRP